MSEEVEAKVKALFPENVEGIYISKNDYDRLYGDLTLENIELKEEIERLNNIINELEKELNKDFNTYMTGNRQNGKVYKAGADNYRMHIYLKLQELKGSDKVE